MSSSFFFCLFSAALLASLIAPSSRAQDRSQTRSMVITKGGIVAAESPLAAQAGAQILARGGNAVDAAIATNAAMGVIEPMMNGIGGDLFAIVYDAKSGKLYGLNASGWAPKNLTPEFLAKQGITKMPSDGINSVTVPGAVDGWSKLLSRFGTKKFSELLAPAIHYASDGFPVAEWDAAYWATAQPALAQDKNFAATYLLNGHAPRVGEIFKNPDLAGSLSLIASGGRDAFYKGEIASRILALEKSRSGAMTAEDLADFSADWVEPISTTYRGWTVYEIPPNGQGIAALMMLNIMENFQICGRQICPENSPVANSNGSSEADRWHIMIEAKKLAYADMHRYVADPKFATVPVEGMLSKDYAAQRAKLIDMSKANCNVSPGEPKFPTSGDTTYLTVVDREGNMVSLIQSNFAEFGSGLVPDGAGFVLQNRGALFTLDPHSPDVLAGHKRPLHTIIPAFMTHGDTRIAFGIMGGFNQAQAHAQFVSNVVDLGMNIQQALEAPRFTKLTFAGCDVEIEDRVPQSIRDSLAQRGHQIELRGDYSADMGGGQAVLRDFSSGVNFGASDPRKDGAAIPQPPPLSH
jgi:gamma-glutamyltranspeptidase / glutathione hydrolase